MQIPRSRDSDGIGAPVRITLLGAFSMSVDGRDVTVASRKARALLGYVARRPGAEVAREILCGMLWADRSEDQARASLRQTLSALRKLLGPHGREILRGTGQALSLEIDHCDLDVVRFQRHAESADKDDVRRAADLYGGEYLEGLSLAEPEFEQWLTAEREALRLLACKALESLISSSESERDYETAITHATRLLTLDPLQEHIHRALMRLFAAQGRHDAALAQYQRCRDELQERLGVRPEHATEELNRSVRAARVGHTERPAAAIEPAGIAAAGRSDEAEQAAPVLPKRPSIAVLQFRSLSGSDEDSYFGEGIAEDIIIELSRNRELFVVGRHSSFRYGGGQMDAVQVGRELGVRYLLSGSIRHADNMVRISVHLTNCVDGSELWAERYDREFKEIFDVQTDIARTVTGTVAGRVAASQVSMRKSARPEDLDAYDHVLRGLQWFQHYDPRDYAKAQQCFERAIALDPSYARPYGLLCLVGVYEWFWDMAEGGLREVLKVGEKAIALDPQDARSHLALGVANLFNWNHARSLYHFDQAIGLNPNDDLILTEFGRYLIYVGRPLEGLMRVREAMRLNPFHPNWYWNIHGRCLHTAERFREAIDAFERVETPQFWTFAYLAACNAMIGETDRACRHRTQALALRPDFTVDGFSRILPYQSPASHKRFLETLRRAGFD